MKILRANKDFSGVMKVLLHKQPKVPLGAFSRGSRHHEEHPSILPSPSGFGKISHFVQERLRSE